MIGSNLFNRKILNKKEEAEIRDRVADFEARTGAELVVAIAPASDPYPGAALRLAIFLGLFASLLLSYFIDFAYPYLYILAQFLFTFIFLPLGRINLFKSWTMVDSEVEREVQEKAVEVFFTYCSEKAGHSNEILFYTSLFERKVEVLVGKNLKEKLGQEILNEVVEIFKEDFRQKKYCDAYRKAIAKLENKVLEVFPDKVSSLGADDLRNEPLWLPAP